MAAFSMSDLAYKEFKLFLLHNNVVADTIRINLAGIGCGGPSFNLVIDEPKSNDEAVKIGNIIFLVDKDLVAEFGGFVMKSAEETGLDSFSLEPLFKGDYGDGCSTCSGCH